MCENKEFDYSKLLGRIREKKFTQKRLAKCIGINDSNFSLKLNNNKPFKSNEIYAITTVLEIQQEMIGIYFFSKV